MWQNQKGSERRNGDGKRKGIRATAGPKGATQWQRKGRALEQARTGRALAQTESSEGRVQ